MSPLSELIEQTKKRHAALTKLQKPYNKVFALISGAFTAFRFFRSSGEFSFGLLGLAALTFVLVYYATSIVGLKMFAQRALALMIDLSLIGLALFISVSFYQLKIRNPIDTLQIQLGEVLTLALWLAFLYFVLFDWRFAGSLGKRVLGLVVVPVGMDKLSFCRSFIRTFLSLPLPVIIGVFLNRWIIGEGQSGVRLFLGDAVKTAFISFVPMSIMFFEGNQSIADRLTRIGIRAPGEAIRVLPKLSSKAWMLLSIFTVSWASLLASLFYIALFKPSLHPEAALPTPARNATWLVNDPRTVGELWSILPIGLKEPTFGIRKIELMEIHPNPFSFQLETSHFRPPADPGPYLRMVKKVPVVRVTLARDRPLQIKLLIVENLLTYAGQRTPMNQRPAFTLLQIATDKKFGLFAIEEQQNILLCWMASGNRALDFYTDVQPNGVISFPISLDQTGFLLVGAGIPY